MPTVRKISIITFVILFIVAGILLLQRSGFKFKTANLKPIAQSPTNTSLELPFPLENPHVAGEAFIHYFFTGTLKEIKNTAVGKEIILDIQGAPAPQFLVTPETRISRITPPYSEQTSQRIRLEDLKAGHNLNISAEYSLTTKQWFTRDVFLPTDRN